MTVKEIFEFLNRKYPVDTALSFDNVGILAGNPQAEVSKAIITLDCTMDTVNKAVDNNCELIITHHPVIFESLKNVLKGSIVYDVIRNNLTVISMHTNLDLGLGGVNDSLCETVFGERGEKVIAEDGYVLNKCSISPISAEAFAAQLKNTLGGSIKYTAPNTEISNILVCSGSGGGYIYEAKAHGCDALLTADVKHNVFLDAERLGIALFDAGHYNTEDIIVAPLNSLLSKEFPQVKFLESHHTAIKYL